MEAKGSGTIATVTRPFRANGFRPGQCGAAVSWLVLTRAGFESTLSSGQICGLTI